MEFVIEVREEDDGRRISDIMRRELGFSSRFLRSVKSSGTIFVNGRVQEHYAPASAGDVIRVVTAREESYFEPEDIDIEVVYEDDCLLIIDKQPGIVVHPTKGCPSGTLANGLANYINTRENRYKIRFINRLDRDTSGLIMVAKNAFVQEQMSRQMVKNEVKKTYLAIVKGIVKDDFGCIDLPIGKSPQGGPRRAVVENGARCVTHFEVKRRFERYGYSLLSLVLETGRTHQIRVHLSYLGHPVAGDTLYGDESGDLYAKRQALHASELAFWHPAARTPVGVRAGVPPDMQAMLDMFSTDC